MITSSQNGKIKHIEKLMQKSRQRSQDGVFIVEGLKMMREVPEALLTETYVSESFSRNTDLMSKVSGKYEIVSDGIFRQMSDTQTPQGILGIVKQPQRQWEGESKKKQPLYIMAENLQDPGNIGTLIRTAEAAGADGIFLTRGCADLYSPKVVRATMGSIFRMSIYADVDGLKTVERMKAMGIQILAAHLEGAKRYDLVDYTQAACILIGNEGNGLTDDLAEAATAAVKIPLLGQSESLNAAVAAGVLLYEAVRQRLTKADSQ